MVAGYDSAHDYAVARLLPDGKLDPDFDGDTGTGNGIVHTVVTPGNDMPSAVQIDKQGRIVVAGTAAGDIGIVRYLPDGKLDKTFAGDGTMVDITPAAEKVAALATVDDGIVVAGDIASTTFVARYTDTGAVATGFGQFGRFVIDADPVNSDAADSLAVRSDGEILVGVTTWGAVTSTPDRLLALTPGGAARHRLRERREHAGADQSQRARRRGRRQDRRRRLGHPEQRRRIRPAAAERRRDAGRELCRRRSGAHPSGQLVCDRRQGRRRAGRQARPRRRRIRQRLRRQAPRDRPLPGGPDPVVDPGPTGSGEATPPVAQPPDPLALSGLTVTRTCSFVRSRPRAGARRRRVHPSAAPRSSSSSTAPRP